MGRDKALIEFEGRPLLLRQLEVARNAGAHQVYISASNNEAYQPLGVSILLDDRPGCGPISGLIAGLRRCSRPLLLVLAVDLPYISAEFLSRLLALCGEQVGVVPRSGSFFEPLAAFYPLAMLTLFEEARDRAELSLQPVLEKGVEKSMLRGYELKEGERELFRNWNTPGSLRGKAPQVRTRRTRGLN
jgi:molybdenum cofactor guanylyltransferase